jgi:hypothetical protein
MTSDDAPDSTAEGSLFGIKDAIANERLDHDERAKSMAAELIDVLKIEEKIISSIRDAKNSVEIDLTTIDDKEPLYRRKQFSGEATWGEVFTYLESYLRKEGCSCEYVMENIGGCCSDIRSSKKSGQGRCGDCGYIGKYDPSDGQIDCHNCGRWRPGSRISVCSICDSEYKKPDIRYWFKKMELTF